LARNQQFLLTWGTVPGGLGLYSGHASSWLCMEVWLGWVVMPNVYEWEHVYWDGKGVAGSTYIRSCLGLSSSFADTSRCNADGHHAPSWLDGAVYICLCSKPGSVYEIDHCTAFGPCSARGITPGRTWLCIVLLAGEYGLTRHWLVGQLVFPKAAAIT